MQTRYNVDARTLVHCTALLPSTALLVALGPRRTLFVPLASLRWSMIPLVINVSTLLCEAHCSIHAAGLVICLVLDDLRKYSLTLQHYRRAS